MYERKVFLEGIANGNKSSKKLFFIAYLLVSTLMQAKGQKVKTSPAIHVLQGFEGRQH